MNRQEFIFILSFFFIAFSPILHGQSPYKFNYQAVVMDDNQTMIKNQIVGLRISIMENTPDGNDLYVETHTKETSSKGLVNLLIGSGSISTGELESIVWGKNPLFVKIEIDPLGGSNYEISSISQLVSVPFAIHANIADSVLKSNVTGSENTFNEWDKDVPDDFSGIYDDLENKPVSWDSSYSSIKGKPDSIHHFVLDAGSKRISNLQDPILSRDAVTKAYIDKLESRIFVLEFALGKDSVKDYENNYYKVVKIYDQYWIAENLRSTYYSDGTPIPLVEDQVGWDSLTSDDAAYCWYDNDSAANFKPHGALYTWTAATRIAGSVSTSLEKVQGICPEGWFLPSNEDWDRLASSIIENLPTKELFIGLHLKTFELWDDYQGSNDFGFSAYPSGIRSFNPSYFDFLTFTTSFWSSTENGEDYAHERILDFQHYELSKYSFAKKQNGFSVRCVKY